MSQEPKVTGENPTWADGSDGWEADVTELPQAPTPEE